MHAIVLNLSKTLLACSAMKGNYNKPISAWVSPWTIKRLSQETDKQAVLSLL
jgi:hypothetical protein